MYRSVSINTPITHETGPDVVIGEIAPGTWQTAEIYGTTRIAHFPDGPNYTTPPNVTGAGPGGDTGNLWDRAATETGWWECGDAYIQLTTFLGAPGGFTLGVLDEAGTTIVERGGSYAAGVGTTTDNVYIVSVPAYEAYAAQPGTVTDAYEADNVSLLIGTSPDWTGWLASAAEYTPPEPDPDPETPGCDSNPLTTLGAYTSFYEANFVTPFLPTQEQINQFIQLIYTQNIFDDIAKYYGDPAEVISGLYVLPVPRENIAGVTDLNALIALNKIPVNMKAAKSNTYRVNFGVIQMPQKYNGSYLDASPYTEASIYLPYAGTYALDVDRIRGRYIGLFADLDLLSGAVVYHLTTSDVNEGTTDMWQLLAEYDGNAARSLPYSSESYRNIVTVISQTLQGVAPIASAAGQAAGGIVNTAAGEAVNTSKVGTAAFGGAVSAGVGANLLSDYMDTGGSRKTGGAPSTMTGQLMHQRPYIIITRPIQIGYPSDLIKEPSAVFGPLSSLSGYAQVTDLRISGVPAQDLDAIAALLASGVIF